MMAIEKFQDGISRIKTLLDEHPEGLNIKTISEMLGIHRNSVAKYLDRLQSQGGVTATLYSSSKIYSLSNKLPAAAVLKISKSCVIVVNHRLIIIGINDPLCEFFKLSKKEITGKTIEQLPFVVQSHPELPALIKEGVKGKESTNPIVILSGDHLFHSMLTIGPVFFENGEPGVSLTIDAPVEHEPHGLTDTGFLPSGPEMNEIEYICQFGPDGTITFVNEIYCYALQKSKADLLGQEWRPVIPEPEFAKIRSSVASIDHDHPVSTREFRTITPKGEHRWQRWKFRGIFDSNGNVKKYHGAGLDITELKQLKENLKKTQQDMEELVRAQREEMQDLNRQLYNEISHREKAEFQLQFTQFSMDNASYMIIWINREGRFVYMNTKAREVLGFSSPEFNLKNIFDILSSDTRFSWNETWEITRRDRQLTIETTFTTNDNREIPVEMVLNYLEFKEKQYCCCFALDIAEKKEILTELRIANLYNRSLIEASLDPLVTIDPDGKISDVNAATVRVTGYQREELIGTDFSKYFTEPEKARAGYEKVFWDGLVKDYELGICHRDGYVTPVKYNATLYRDESRNIMGVFAAARDITEQKKAEEEQLRLAAIVEHSDDAIIGKSLDGIILSWNTGAERLYGYSAPEAIGQHISMLIPPRQIDDIKHIIGKIRSGEPVLHYATVRRRKDGRNLQVSLTVSPIKDTKGNLIGVSTIARDITE